uniref:Beta-glucosidase n=1 Tax=Quercus lobata TaxID=97700 RepID=A0A7N2KYB0_QUELO
MAGLGSLKKLETTIFGASRTVSSLRNENKSLRLTIRCWKGSVPPTTITDKTTSTDPIADAIAATSKITRKDFPTEFKFGCSTSAFQTEGKGDEGGRGPVTWDSYIEDDDGITDVAVDSYNRDSPICDTVPLRFTSSTGRQIQWLLEQPDCSTQAGEIGISIQAEWFLPASDTIQDQDAARRALDFFVGWFLEPLVFGDYPFIMKALVRDGLPEFTDDEKTLIKGSFDFIGINYYTSRYATAVTFDKDATFSAYSDYQFATVSGISNPPFLFVAFVTAENKDGEYIGAATPGSTKICIYPQGLSDVLVYMSNKYNNPKFFVTENGYPEKRDDTIAVETALQDDVWIQHILGHLYAISVAMKQGADVNGYFMWALMDCMEMGSGYTVWYRLAYTDYLNNLERILKKSAKWLKLFLAS